jgi:hypothetical protein
MPQEDMLTAREATKAFRDAGLSETTFRKRVKDGKIEKHLPKGRERGALYPRDQVLAIIAETAKEPKRHPKPHFSLKPTTFTQATPQEMSEIALLLETFYTTKINIEKRAAWIERNSEIAYILRCEGKAVGCAFLMPLTQEKIMTILSREVKPPTRPGEILLYESGKTVHLYLRSVVVWQGASKKQRRYWAARLILGLAKAVIGLGARGVIIEKIYAQVDTKAAEQVLKRIGFMQITSATVWKNFMLDMTASGAELAMRYKKALTAWHLQYEEE